MPEKKQRILLLDELRGLAVLCMVFYHAFYLLYAFFQLEWARVLYKFFTPAQPFFAGLFILIAGVSCHLTRSNARRGLKVLAVALGITLVTAVVMPRIGMDGAEIYFGILHFMAISMLLFALLRPLFEKIPPTLGFLLALALFVAFYSLPQGRVGIGAFSVAVPQSVYSTNYFFWLGLPKPGFTSADYFPLVPHFFLFLCGTYLGSATAQAWMYRSHCKPLAFFGRHSLVIYVAHQPVVYAAAWVVLEILAAVSA